MKLSSLIGHTSEISEIVFKSELPADVLIARFFKSKKYLGSNDRKFIAENLYDLLRNKLKIEKLLNYNFEENLENENIKIYLIKAIILNNFINGVKINYDEVTQFLGQGSFDELLKLPETQFKFNNKLEELSFNYSIPIWFLEKLNLEHDLNELEIICKNLNKTAPITLRTNTHKTNIEELVKSLSSKKINCEIGNLSPNAIILKNRLNIFQIDNFKNGEFEVQDEGSQILAHFVDPKPGKIMLDACCGSGGKSLALSAIMKNRGEIFAIDINPKRLNDIKKRIIRSGSNNIRVEQVDEKIIPKKYLNFADYVLVDSPCSGSGTIRRNPGLKWKLNEKNLHELNIKQSEILQNYSATVKVGGRLVYATCSILKDENENIVNKFLSENNNFKLIDAAEILKRYNLQNLAKNNYLKLYPHIHNTDGFFAAAFERIS